jgi:hypothetical protein
MGKHVLRTVSSLVCALAVVGCGADDGNPKPVPGSVPPDDPGYASGPYGTTKGSIIANDDFKGLITLQASDLQDITLKDFYNPTGTDKYPAGSPYGEGNPKPRALLVDVASVWCGPCNEEAATVLPAKYQAYSPRGGQFMLVLIDGPTPGTSATQTQLKAWEKKYKQKYPGALDPENAVGSIFQQDSFPGNLIIDTTKMEIVEAVAGVPSESFWATYESLLNP